MGMFRMGHSTWNEDPIEEVECEECAERERVRAKATEVKPLTKLEIRFKKMMEKCPD